MITQERLKWVLETIDVDFFALIMLGELLKTLRNTEVVFEGTEKSLENLYVEVCLKNLVSSDWVWHW